MSIKAPRKWFGVSLGGGACAVAAVLLVASWRGETRQERIVEPYAITFDDLIAGASRRISERPGDWNAYLARARLHLAAREFDHAEADIQLVLDRSSDEASLLNAQRLRCLVLMQGQRHPEAVEALSQAIESASAGESVRRAELSDFYHWRAVA